MNKKIRIKIDYSVCGDGNGIDPRTCCRCLQSCVPAIFLLHQTLNAKESDPFDPQKWRVTPLWTSLCTLCMNCVKDCPEGAVTVEY